MIVFIPKHLLDILRNEFDLLFAFSFLKLFLSKAGGLWIIVNGNSVASAERCLHFHCPETGDKWHVFHEQPYIPKTYWGILPIAYKTFVLRSGDFFFFNLVDKFYTHIIKGKLNLVLAWGDQTSYPQVSVKGLYDQVTVMLTGHSFEIILLNLESCGCKNHVYVPRVNDFLDKKFVTA